jgi:hypothetical protein
MSHIRYAAVALMAIGGVVLIENAASAQAPPYGYGYGYGYSYRYAPGSYYSYGANRANPGIAPNGWDLDNPRDFQLQGGR